MEAGAWRMARLLQHDAEHLLPVQRADQVLLQAAPDAVDQEVHLGGRIRG
jgi:hypothetical protein